MDRKDITESAVGFVRNSEYNYISEKDSISENAAGMKIYDDPIFAFGSSGDAYFARLKNPGAIGEHFILPSQWLPEAKTVISFFLPFSQDVKKGNRKDLLWPSDEWLHGRYEGQAMLGKLCLHLKSELENAGYRSIVPSMEEKFWCSDGFLSKSAHGASSFTSNWSERHVAFVCGLGTFSLSKGLITSKGVCGRFGSIVTELSLPPDRRAYTELYENCILCGKCAKNCPAAAISLETGKDHAICSRFLNETLQKHSPRYGCGKCQVAVPCESAIPGKHAGHSEETAEIIE
ncbi:hypothetical protein SDC9_48104 [bioreactor metagenome]|uniref:4Fe-4S ferredoxin-type domain-containing protein n=1 Tax=bioreactor metagenome TaxID=1076179 RepID=A0A644WHU6_9ZZZZ